MEISIVNLDNNARKGTYIYLKEKGLRGRYYKYHAGDLIDSYKKFYLDRYQTKKPFGTLKEYRDTYKNTILKKPTKNKLIYEQANKYIEKLKNRPTVQKALKKGLTSTIIKDIHSAGNTEIRKAKEHLLRPLVLDKNLLELLIKDENFNKLKSRLEYQTLGLNKDNHKLVEGTVFNKVPQEVLDDLRKTIKKGETIDMSDYIKKLKKKGWNNLDVQDVVKDMKIGRVDLKIIFRKG